MCARIMRRFIPALTCTKSSGLKSIVDIGLCDAKRQAHVVWPQRADAVGTARLQQDRQIVRLAERDELGRIRRGQRLQIAEHKRDGRVARRDFDLRDVAFRFERGHELAERSDALADFRQQRVADGKIGDEARVVLAKADQHLALLRDPFDR